MHSQKSTGGKVLRIITKNAFFISQLPLLSTNSTERHFQVSGADLNPSSSSSHILILSSTCKFDTIVPLVVMFITYATLKVTELN